MKRGLIIFLLFFNVQLKAQQTSSTEVDPFEITIEYHYNQVFLTSTNGCNWLGLNFNFFNHEDPKLLDNVGVSVYSPKLVDEIKSDRSFMFILTKSETTFELKALKGTNWEELSFEYSENYTKVTLTENGITRQ